MNGRFDLYIITQPRSEVYCGYFRRLVFGNLLRFSHITGEEVSIDKQVACEECPRWLKMTEVACNNNVKS